MPSRFLSLVLLALTFVVSAHPADAQFWKKAKEAAQRGAERAVERETEKRADRAVTGAFEAGDDAVGCVVGDEACAAQAREDGKEVVLVDAAGEPLPTAQQPAAVQRPAQRPVAPPETFTDDPIVPGSGSARAVLRDALRRYEADMAGVENYTLTQSVLGTETVLYAERTGDKALYTSYLVGTGGVREAGDRGQTEMSANMYTLLGRLGDEARYVGTATVGGVATHALTVDDFGAVARDLDMIPEQAGDAFDIDAATFFIARGDHRAHKMTMEGTMQNDGRTSPVTVTIRFLDYRTVDGLTLPFRTVMEIGGMADQLDPGERAEAQQQLDETMRQMESMPAEQRAMMERMMGDSMAQLRQMLAGEGFQIEIQVTDVQVNAGRPD